MNPYDFARIDWSRLPERRKPIWHHRLIGSADQKLYSGHLEIDIYAETPIFIADPRNTSPDPKRPAQSMQNKQGEYIIPGSSLKGMLRSVVETLGNGCLTLFDEEYERGRVDYEKKILPVFHHCHANTHLCIACRMFGMLERGARGVFLGKINVGDARSYPEKVYTYDPMYTAVLVEPKPHHESFYLDEKREHIAGRKFYFHHSPDDHPHSANRIVLMGGRPANRYIQPLDCDTKLHLRIDFTNLEADEFSVLLLAVALEKDMRHKIGYGKPLGLGSISLSPASLTLVDYAARYQHPTAERGKTVFEGNALWDVLYKHIDAFPERMETLAMQDLRRIWRWPAASDVEYYYPSKRDWFDTPASRGMRIADTRRTP